MVDRINRLRRLFQGAGVDALYVTDPENRFYLSGFSGTAGALLICRDSSYLLTDFRYTEQASRESPAFKVIETSGLYMESLLELIKENSIIQLGCEGNHLTYNQFISLKEGLKGVDLRSLTGMVEGLRICKDDFEINLICEAVRFADEGFRKVLPLIKPGVREREIALQLEYDMRQSGADGVAFKIVVASGIRSAMPHGLASSKILQHGDLVTIDFGAVYCGYHSDITRTVVLGGADIKQQEIYNTVLEAQMTAINAIKAGVKASDIDLAARNTINNRGYGACFGHSTGHGLGLSVHEDPRLSLKDETILENGMVVTVEPGIYLPAWGGVRIEDTVVVEKNGCRVLSKLPKDTLLVLS